MEKDNIIFMDNSKKIDQALHPCGIKFATSLIADHYDRVGRHLAKYNLGSGVVTNAGVIFMAQSFTGQMSVSAFNYHDSGTGSVAAAVTDTTISTSAGIPARAIGVQTSPITGQYTTIGTQIYTAPTAIQEWGLFSALTNGTMWDRKTFAVINVQSGDSIQYTYNLVLVSGG